jgi:microsomal dipeptidase-like Zn-dependent dipeptidase
MSNILQQSRDINSTYSVAVIYYVSSLFLFSVGLGSDFDGIGSVPRGLEDVSKYPDLVCFQCRGSWILLNSCHVDC